MSGIVTRKFRTHNAKQLHESFSEVSADRMYLFIGHPTPWANDSAPTTPIDTPETTEYSYWRSMMGAKKVSVTDVTFGAPRTNWANNTLYDEYNGTSQKVYSNNHIIVSSANNVYKCLFNNKGANSTVEPSGTSTSTITLADGYKWKFMYYISGADYNKFVTAGFIPVKTLTADDGSSQWSVQSAAVNGAIDVIDVRVPGSSYLSTNGVVAAVNGANVTMANTANSTSDSYVGSTMFLRSGLGSGQLRTIVDYVGGSRKATLNSAFTTTPNTSTQYYVGPRVIVWGNGAGCLAYANVVSGNVTFVNVITPGTGYSIANVSITANNGTGATAMPCIAPMGGHGSDPLDELSGHNVIISVSLAGSESNTLPTTNQFRTFGLLVNPNLANGSSANGSSYRQSTQLTVSSVKSAFVEDDLITGVNSSATARVVKFANTNSANTRGILDVVDVDLAFSSTESIIANTSGANAVITAINSGSLKANFGDIIYSEHKTPTSRSSAQTETFKLVVQF